MKVAEAKAQVIAIRRAFDDRAKMDDKVRSAFSNLDKDNSGALDSVESRVLVSDLCAVMGVASPTDAEYQQHLMMLDLDQDGKLSCGEVGRGIVGALSFKLGGLEHFLTIAERDGLSDDSELPSA